MNYWSGLLYLMISTAGMLSGCMESTSLPACPDSLKDTSINDSPVKSAGCLAIDHGRLLVVQGINNKVSIPGGSGNADEPAHCTAHRETWEETGLDVNPTALIRVFDNGFHLFECQWDVPKDVTEIHETEDLGTPPFYLEIQRAMWLNQQDFEHYEWRFPEQMEWLKHMLESEK